MTEQIVLDPEKYHVLTDSMRKKLFVLTAMFLLVLLPAFLYAYYAFAVSRPSQNVDEAEYEINQGSSVAEIAKNLSDKNLINSEFLFKLYIKANDLQGSIQAGVYKIPSGSSIAELATIFQKGKNDRSITFIEGWRSEEFAYKAAQEFKEVDYKAFVERAKEHEGYLFPDTYSFNSGVNEDAIIDKLLNTFTEKTKDVLTDDALARVGLTQEQAVITASIVEREIHNAEDLPIVAGILINRFKEGELIGADATTQYVMGSRAACILMEQVDRDLPYCYLDVKSAEEFNWWPQNILTPDLEFESPYNTRKVLGFPPQPISNPGLKSLEAVLNYIETDYRFYLTDADGNAHYARTLEEHNKNIAMYLN